MCRYRAEEITALQTRYSAQFLVIGRVFPRKVARVLAPVNTQRVRRGGGSLGRKKFFIPETNDILNIPKTNSQEFPV
ncbi:MAG: hypothetical protein V7K67_07575 [Nostoc sp.]